MFKLPLPHIALYEEGPYKGLVAKSFAKSTFLRDEKRSGFSAEIPMHNRFFSNGDKLLVGLVNFKGTVLLNYDGTEYTVSPGHFVFFDDNVQHSWVFKNADLSIFYYRIFAADLDDPVYSGDICIDSHFGP